MAELPWWRTESSQQGVRELLGRYRAKGLTEEACNKMLEDHHIDYISSHLCEKWRLLLPLLSIPKVTESDFERDYPKEEERRRGFLLKWKEAEGSDATYRMLIAALLKIGNKQDAEGVCEMLVGEVTGQPEADGSKAEVTSATPAYPPEVVKSIQQQLKRNLDKIMTQYAAYVSTLCECIKEKGISVMNLKTYLYNLPALSYRHDKYEHVKLLEDKQKMLESCDTIDGIIQCLSANCASFLNYGIFESIASRYKVSHTEHEDLNYSECLKTYLNKHKLSELVRVVRQMAPLVKTSKMEMTFKLDIELTNRIAKLFDLKIAIADALGLDQLALELTDINTGSVIVTFLIPMAVLDAVLTEDGGLSRSQLVLLKALPIIWVKYEGHEYSLNCEGSLDALSAMLAHQYITHEEKGDLLQWFQLVHEKKILNVKAREPGRTGFDTTMVIGETTPTTPTIDEAVRRRAAIQIRDRLIELGDIMEKEIQLDAWREDFERQLKRHSVFQMAYDQFKHACISALARTRGQMRTGWDQLYLLMYGQYLVTEKLYREAQGVPPSGQGEELNKNSQGVDRSGQSEELYKKGESEEVKAGGVPEAAETRASIIARYFRDIVHDIGLEKWIQAQGGMANVGGEVVGEKRVEITLPEESSVDKERL